LRDRRSGRFLEQGPSVRRVAFVGGLVLAAFLIVRAVVEQVTIDWSDPASYQHDWGRPSVAGVLLVHVLPGLLAAVAIVIVVVRRSRVSNAGSV
jgi:hypothetical protein